MRFPGYANSWIKTTLGDECDSLEYGIGASAIPFDGSNRYLRITDINDPSGEYVSPSFLDEEALLQQNDILLARTGATVGQSFLYESDDVKTYYAGFLIRARVVKGNQRFLYYQLKTDSFRRWVKVMSARSGQPGINAEEYASYPLFVSNDSEMGKISAFLRIIDKRIEVQNKIIEELLALKKALYNKVFGTDAFNCRDIALHHFMKMPDKVREMHPDRHKLITVRLNEGGVIKNTNVETLKMASTIYYRRSAGQFIYGKQNIFHGAFGIVPCHLDGYASSGDVPALDFKEGVNSSFLMRSLSFSCYNWEKYASGTGSKRIHEKNCLNCKFECPHWALSKDSKKCSQP